MAADVLDPPAPLSVDGLAEAFRHFAERFVERLPNLLAALLFLVVTVVVARLVRRGIEKALGRASAELAERLPRRGTRPDPRRSSTEEYVHRLVARLAAAGAIALGMVVALSILGVNLGVLVGSLGLATVALGFALQDIVSNFFAGIVLLLEHPFIEGDVIATEDAQGTVEVVRVRATQLRTPDGQLVLVPNKLLFTNVLTNASASMRRRLEVHVAVPYGQDAGRAREALLAAADRVEGVGHDKGWEPRVLLQDLGYGAVDLRLWFWADPRADDLLRVRSEVVGAADAELRNAGLDLTMPSAPQAASPNK
jgi:small conductance mechanosensitive channel